MTQITRIDYMYRDASNYKFHGQFTVEGELTLADLLPYLYQGEYFDPEKVGLSHLLNVEENEDDHPMHEITDIQPTTDGPADHTKQDILERFRSAHEKGWLDLGFPEY